tara:strand:+ start:529 stop:879 length:351 start_codon:yes stop_codon:yes gene_type:complete
MARLKVRSRDRNRFTKKYPFVRAPERLVFEGDGGIQVELLTLSFSNESSKTGTYQLPFEGTDFRVLVSARDSTSSDSANVALTIDESVSDVSQVKVDASAPFTGLVDVIALRITTS